MTNDLHRPDRRIQRTQRALRAALLALISEKPYPAITVEEIAQRADLSRATFYLHYGDKDNLLLDYFRDLLADRVEQFAAIPLLLLADEAAETAGTDAPMRPIVAAFRHAAENAPVYRLVLKGECAGQMATELRHITTRAFDDLLHSKVQEAGLTSRLQVPLDLSAQAFVAAYLACLSWWLEHDMPQSPEEMARHFRLMFFPGIRVALGL